MLPDRPSSSSSPPSRDSVDSVGAGHARRERRLWRWLPLFVLLGGAAGGFSLPLASCGSSDSGSDDAGDAGADGEGGFDTSFAVPLDDGAGFIPDVQLDVLQIDDGNFVTAPDANACLALACPGQCVTEKAGSPSRCIIQLAQGGAYDIAVQAGIVYWTNPGALPGTGSVLGTPSVALGTTTGPTTLASGQDLPYGIAVNATHVFWEDGDPANGTILSSLVPVVHDGGVTTVGDAALGDAGDGGLIGATALASGQAAPTALAIDATSVYWTSAGSTSAANGTVVKVPLGGGTPVTLASGQSDPAAIAVDATSVYWINLTYISPQVYAGTVLKVPIAGGAVTTLAFGQSSPTAIAVDSTYVYWTQLNPGTVMKAPIGGGTAITVASNQGVLGGLAVDSQSLYWAVRGGNHMGSIVSSPVGGNAVVTLKSGLDFPRSLATDATSLYWTDDIDGTVTKITPK